MVKGLVVLYKITMTVGDLLVLAVMVAEVEWTVTVIIVAGE